MYKFINAYRYGNLNAVKSLIDQINLEATGFSS